MAPSPRGKVNRPAGDITRRRGARAAPGCSGQDRGWRRARYGPPGRAPGRPQRRQIAGQGQPRRRRQPRPPVAAARQGRRPPSPSSAPARAAVKAPSWAAARSTPHHGASKAKQRSNRGRISAGSAPGSPRPAPSGLKKTISAAGAGATVEGEFAETFAAGPRLSATGRRSAGRNRSPSLAKAAN